MECREEKFSRKYEKPLQNSMENNAKVSSSALWQGSNSKIKNHGFSATVALFKNDIHFWPVNGIYHCLNNALTFC